MRKSQYGEETTFFWEGNALNEQLSTQVIPSTLKIDSDQQKEITEKFAEAKLQNPDFFDGTLWRYEGHEDLRGGTRFLLSETSYMPHNILRHENFPISYENNRFNSRYPNAFNVNAVQVTDDGYALIGVKGEKSDQRGLGVMGAGFIKRVVEREESLPPENVFLATLRECNEETTYSNKTTLTESDIENFRALGTIFGSNHDTTTCVYVPLYAKKDDVSIGNLEHSDLLFLPTDKPSLEKFLVEGGMQGIPAVDHLLGCVELYLKYIK